MLKNGIIILFVVLLFGGAVTAQVFKERTQTAPLVVSASDVYGNVQPGTNILFRGWVIGAGGNKYGRWMDVLELSEYGQPKPRGVRVYHTFLSTLAKDEFVDVRGYLPPTGEKFIRADSITISYLPKPKF